VQRAAASGFVSPKSGRPAWAWLADVPAADVPQATIGNGGGGLSCTHRLQAFKTASILSSIYDLQTDSLEDSMDQGV
jgi:hypothetical protein